MATSAAEQRQALIAVTSLAEADLERLWPLIATGSAESVRDALMDLIPGVADKWGTAAATLAADWYDELRAEAAVRGAFVAEPAPLPGTSRYEALVRWGVDPLFRPEPDPDAALSKVGGGLQRIVADGHRETVRLSATRDPRAHGWKRVGTGASCEFCRMLIGRGAVYTEATAHFESHDRCNCAAIPEFHT